MGGRWMKLILAPATTLGSLLMVCTLLAQAENPPYLNEMPSVERVLQAMRSADPGETAARQMGALLQMKSMIEKMADGRYWRNQLTSDEKRLSAEYNSAYIRISQSKPEYANIAALHGYDIDPKLTAELLNRFFSDSFRLQFEKADAANAAAYERYRKQLAVVSPEAQAKREAQQQANLKAATSSAGNTSEDESEPCPVVETQKVRPAGNSTLTVKGAGYTYHYTETDTRTGAVLNSFTEDGNFIHTTLYLLDEDAEAALHDAGIGPGLLGNTLATFSFMDAGSQVKDMPGMGLLSALSSAMGQGDGPKEISKLAEADYECGMKGIHLHTVSQMTTDGNAVGTFRNVPPGTYYLYGRFYRITKPVRGGGMVWNFKVHVAPGVNFLRLTVDDAALK
jgi:hypothetical protein